MNKIPREKIEAIIAEQTKMPMADIRARIDRKLKELSGLISEDGAAHIIANELNVSVFSARATHAKIGEIYPGMRNVVTTGKVMKLYNITSFNRNEKQGQVRAVLLADETDRIRCSFWNNAVAMLDSVKEGDIIRIQNGFARENTGRCELSITDMSSIEINPEGVVIENIAESKVQTRPTFIKSLSKFSGPVTMIGTIVQIYPLTFFVPKAERQEGINYTLEQKNNCVGNMILDDGTGTVRLTAYTSTITAMTKLTVDELKIQAIWDEVKKEMVGKLVRIDGKSTYNQSFDRIEVIIDRLTVLDPQSAQELLGLFPNVE